MLYILISTFISALMAVLTIFFMKRRILSIGGGMLLICFWFGLGILSVQREPLKLIMSLVSFNNFTNFLLTGSFFFLIVLIFILYINQKKHHKLLEKLAQEIALLEFESQQKK